MDTKSGKMSAEMDEAARAWMENATPEEYAPKGMFTVPVQRKAIVTLGVGDIVDVTIQGHTLQARIVYINLGKQRLSIQPLGKLKLT